MKNTNRREFIINGTIMVGSVMGGLTLGSRLFTPETATAATFTFPEPSCGSKTGHGKKVLVAYASFCGSTGGVAEAIGQTLCRHGAQADVRLVNNITDIAGYQAVIVGSAVRSNSWRPEGR